MVSLHAKIWIFQAFRNIPYQRLFETAAPRGWARSASVWWEETATRVSSGTDRPSCSAVPVSSSSTVFGHRHWNQKSFHFITTRIRSLWEGNDFSRACLFRGALNGLVQTWLFGGFQPWPNPTPQTCRQTGLIGLLLVLSNFLAIVSWNIIILLYSRYTLRTNDYVFINV